MVKKPTVLVFATLNRGKLYPPSQAIGTLFDPASAVFVLLRISPDPSVVYLV